MGNPATSEVFYRLLDKNLREVSEGAWKDLPSQISQIFRSISSDGASEEFFEVSDIGDVPAFNGKLEFESPAPGFLSRIEPKEYAKGTAFERKLIDDKKYSVLDDRVGSLTKSAQRTKEKLAIEASFAYAFSTAHTYLYSEEGVALCSDSHTNKTGASTTSGFDNAGTSSLSKTSIAATRLAMRRFMSDNGQRIDISPDTLIVPDALYDTAMEIVGSEKDPTSANNTKNMMYGRLKVLPLMRLDDYDTNNWFMVDSSAMKRDLLWIDRIAPETKMTVDFDTFAVKWSIYFRCGGGHKGWRWIYGHAVS